MLSRLPLPNTERLPVARLAALVAEERKVYAAAAVNADQRDRAALRERAHRLLWWASWGVIYLPGDEGPELDLYIDLGEIGDAYAMLSHPQWALDDFADLLPEPSASPLAREPLRRRPLRRLRERVGVVRRMFDRPMSDQERQVVVDVALAAPDYLTYYCETVASLDELWQDRAATLDAGYDNLRAARNLVHEAAAARHLHATSVVATATLVLARMLFVAAASASRAELDTVPLFLPEQAREMFDGPELTLWRIDRDAALKREGDSTPERDD